MKKDVTHERNHVWFGGDERIRTAGAAFAEPCLTTWRRRRVRTQAYERRGWSGRRGSNPRLSPWQGDALPLSHSRLYVTFATLRYHIRGVLSTVQSLGNPSKPATEISSSIPSQRMPTPFPINSHCWRCSPVE